MGRERGEGVSPRHLEPEVRAHQHRRVVAAWLTGDADPADARDPSPRWCLAGFVAGVLTMAAWGAVGLLDQPSEARHEGEPVTVTGRCP